MDEKKSNRLFIIIYVSVAFSIPTITGIILTAVYQRSVFLESFYIVFGAITLIFALARSRRRDTYHYRANKDNNEDFKPETNKEFRLTQITLYATGIFLFVCSLISFLIGKYVLFF